MNKLLEKCEICPLKCGVNRLNNKGICGADVKVKIALASLHYFEEPCISGKDGSGTVFFSNCNLRCIYCQNHEISQEGKGIEITVERLAEIFIDLQNKGANNINLVTPTMYVYQIIEAINIAKKNGLCIPIVYNSSGYESVGSLKRLEGYIDVYLPDFKYYDNELAYKYSGIKNYFEIASNAILEMYRQVGSPIINDKRIIQKGLMIRHMILPGHTKNTKEVLKWISENLKNNVYVSIMAQYFPAFKARESNCINRKITSKELHIVEKFMQQYNIEKGYIQKLGKHEEEYVPDFNLSF